MSIPGEHVDFRGDASVRAYLDNDVVSGFRKRDLKPEDLAAMTRLKELADQGRISLVVSAIHDDEAAPLPEQYRKEQQEILAIFARVEFADDHRFYGMNLIDLGTRGYIANPLVEDDPIAQQLRKIGLERRDAHHVMLAIRRECDVFVTCDVRTILKYRPTVEAAFPIRLRRPSELLRDYNPKENLNARDR